TVASLCAFFLTSRRPPTSPLFPYTTLFRSYGVNGGKPGRPFCVTVDIEGSPRDLGGLVDGEPVLAGQVVRVVTTGGGGWGDPLEREPEFVARDVRDGKVSLAAACDEYGVVLVETAIQGE